MNIPRIIISIVEDEKVRITTMPLDKSLLMMLQEHSVAPVDMIDENHIFPVCDNEVLEHKMHIIKEPLGINNDVATIAVIDSTQSPLLR